jgi:hypothetical protein
MATRKPTDLLYGTPPGKEISGQEAAEKLVGGQNRA